MYRLKSYHRIFFFAKRSRRFAREFVHDLAHIHRRRKIQFFADIFDCIVGGAKKLSGLKTAFSVFLLNGSFAGELFEESIKIRLSHTAKRRKIGHVKIFVAVAFYEIKRRADAVKFL